ncbi:MAG: ABC transporter permease [Candidatus Diapherotrites archaeon]|nr:ABC transporter permease [Candidatus Diapherotrites archaeon]
MLDFEVFSVALRNLSRQGLRSYLTLIGVVIGVAAIVTLISLGSGLNNAVTQQFEKLGANTIFIAPGSSSLGGSNSAATTTTQLTDSELSQIKGIPQVSDVLAPLTNSAIVSFARENARISIYAVDAKEAKAFQATGFAEVGDGRGLQPSDTFAVMIGYNIAHGKTMFPKEVRVRDKIIIKGKSFRVVGITKKSSTSFGGGPNTNTAIFMTKKGYEQIYPNTKPVFAMIRAESKEDINAVQEKIQKIFERDYGKNQKEFTVISSEQVLESINNILGIIQLFLVGIAAISLLVGCIGIMNTMIMAVMERTKEIGVMKAIGATDGLVLSIFVLEAGFIGLVGGIIGIIIGYALAFLVGIIANASGFALDVQFDIMLVIGAMAFSLIVGMASGAYPASRAAKLDPVEALRGSE